MTTSNKKEYNIEEEEEGEEEIIDILELLRFFLSKWYWFLISLIVIFGIAIIYLLSTPKIYSRSASLLIKENMDSQSAIAGEISESFSNMGMSVNKNNVNNELQTLLSPSLMMEVVQKLHLNWNYHIEKGLSKETLYDSTLPVNISVIDSFKDIEGAFKIKLLENNNIELSDFEIVDKKTDNNILKCNLNDTINSPIGKLKIVPTNYYKKDSVYTIYVSHSNLYNTTRAFVSNLTVNLSNKQSTIIDITLTDNCIKRSEDVLNTLISVYNFNWIKDNNKISESTSVFINERLKIVKKELDNIDKEISTYKSKNLLPDVNAVSTMYLENDKETNSQILIINDQLYMTTFIRDYLKNESNKNLLLPSTDIGNVSINSQISEYNTNQLLYNNLIKNSSEQNPLVNDLDHTLKDMRKAIISSIDNQITNLNSQLKTLQQEKKKVNNNISNNPAQAEYLMSTERQQKIKESIYLFLLQKREENELSQAFIAYKTRLITPPYGDKEPISPKKSMILLFAFIMGFGIPAIVLFILKKMDTSVHKQSDFDGMAIPFLGEIPLLKNKKKFTFSLKKQNKKQLILKVKEGNRDTINEAFRILRANLEFMVGHDKKSNVIVLSSFFPNSGKSFLTLNIAVSLAINGKKVLVIDGDLRYASMSDYINSPQKGLTSFLSDNKTIPEDIIVTDKKYKNLKFIPVGTIPPNPTELLMNERLGELLNILRSSYDYIFIDCPPINIIADTSIIEKLSDRMIFVIRARLADKHLLKDLDNLYIEQKYKNMSVVLNGTLENDSRYDYKSRYHQEYYRKYRN